MTLAQKFAAFLWGAVLSLPLAAHANTWSVYRDSADGCRIDYPTGLFIEDPFDVAQDYQSFSGPDENTFFRVMGVENEDNLSAGQVREVYLEENAPGDVVYDKTRKDFLVLSGYRGSNIFYTRVAVSGDNRNLCIVEITYPRKNKRSFDSIVTRMSRSFRVE